MTVKILAMSLRSKSLEILTSKSIRPGIVLLLALILATSLPARDKTTPDEWLQKMSSAIQMMDYTGTVISQSNGEAQLLKVVHKKIDGVVNERIVSQEGNGLEIIRIGDEVHCILPDKKTVLIEHWGNAGTLIAALPNSKIEPGAQYDVLILQRDQRVAGRNTVNIAIRPNDSYRFEHRFWLDEETGFPLRAELIDQEGTIIDQLKFADIRFDANIAEQLLAPSVNLDNFTWYANPADSGPEVLQTDWVSDDLPAGFRIISTRSEAMSGSDKPVMHLLVGDGIASVSVFISEAQGREFKRSATRGTANSYSTEKGGFQITAVGEVPPQTVRAIATSMSHP